MKQLKVLEGAQHVMIGLVFGGLFSMATHAEPGPPRRPISWADKPINCATIASQFQELKERVSEQNLMFAGYTDGAYVAVDRLYKEYEGLEGKNRDIKVGQFKGLNEVAKEMDSTKESIYLTLDVVNQRFDQLMEVLPNCLK